MRLASSICALLFCICSQPLPCSATVIAQDDARLVRVVALARHGVRAPTQDASTLSLWSTRPWPQWPVKRAHLTSRGAEQISFMWAHLGRTWSMLGLWGAEDGAMPQPGSVFVHADTDQRTRGTAEALLRGLGCTPDYAVTARQRDPLFHPVKAGDTNFDATQVMTALREALPSLRADMRAPLARLDAIAGPLAPAMCRRHGLAPGCRLTDLPDAVYLSSDGRNIRLEGALGIASDMAEIFLLEYAQWPGQNAGWGQVDEKTLQCLLPLHSTVFDLINRIWTLAQARGTALVREMTAALAGQHPDARVNAASLTVFVGHDTNLATAGRLLGLHWQAEGYPVDDIPPGSVLLLELWEQAGCHTVRPRFVALPLKMLHAPLSSLEARSHLTVVTAGKDMELKEFFSLTHQCCGRDIFSLKGE